MDIIQFKNQYEEMLRKGLLYSEYYDTLPIGHAGIIEVTLDYYRLSDEDYWLDVPAEVLQMSDAEIKRLAEDNKAAYTKRIGEQLGKKDK